MRIRRSTSEWAALIQEQKNSGIGIPEFCRSKNIHPNLFYRKIKTASQTSGFVKLQTSVIRNKAIIITCGNISVHIQQPVIKEDIVMVLNSMKEAGYAELSWRDSDLP